MEKSNNLNKHVGGVRNKEISDGVSVGFPSPADDYNTYDLDLNDLLVTNRNATVFMKMEQNAMIGTGIYAGDILVVDRSLTPVSGKVVVVYLNGEFLVRRLERSKYVVELYPENDNYPIILINDSDDFRIWGVVKHSIHKL